MLRALTGSLATVLCVGSRAPLAGRWLGFELMGTVSAEFRRAIAAEHRYDELRRKDAAALALEGIARAEIPRRVFVEFYSSTSSVTGRRRDDRYRPPPAQIPAYAANAPGSSLGFWRRSDDRAMGAIS
jgi:hypothetical protein